MWLYACVRNHLNYLIIMYTRNCVCCHSIHNQFLTNDLMNTIFFCCSLFLLFLLLFFRKCWRMVVVVFDDYYIFFSSSSFSSFAYIDMCSADFALFVRSFSFGLSTNMLGITQAHYPQRCHTSYTIFHDEQPISNNFVNTSCRLSSAFERCTIKMRDNHTKQRERFHIFLNDKIKYVLDMLREIHHMHNYYLFSCCDENSRDENKSELCFSFVML